MQIDVRDVPVFVINLDSHKDKFNRTLSILKKANFRYVERIPAISNPLDGQLGLIHTHIEYVTRIDTPFILLEDDVAINSQNFQISIPDESDCCYLGNSAWGFWDGKSKPRVSYQTVGNYPNVLRVQNMLSAHAILFTKSRYLRHVGIELSKDWSSGKSCFARVDQAYATLQREYNVYALNSPLFYQKRHQDSMTDNEKYTNQKLTDYSFRAMPLKQLLIRLAPK